MDKCFDCGKGANVICPLLHFLRPMDLEKWKFLCMQITDADKTKVKS